MKHKPKLTKKVTALIVTLLCLVLGSGAVMAATTTIYGRNVSAYRILGRTADSNQIMYCFDADLYAPKNQGSGGSSYDQYIAADGELEIPNTVLEQKLQRLGWANTDENKAKLISQVKASLYYGYAGVKEDTNLSTLKSALSTIDMSKYPTIQKYIKDTYNIDFTGFTDNEINNMAEGGTQVAIWNVNGDINAENMAEYKVDTDHAFNLRYDGNVCTNFMKWAVNTSGVTVSYSDPANNADRENIFLDISEKGIITGADDEELAFMTEVNNALMSYTQSVINASTTVTDANPTITLDKATGSLKTNTSADIKEPYVTDVTTLTAKDIMDNTGAATTFKMGFKQLYDENTYHWHAYKVNDDGSYTDLAVDGDVALGSTTSTDTTTKIVFATDTAIPAGTTSVSFNVSSYNNIFAGTKIDFYKSQANEYQNMIGSEGKTTQLDISYSVVPSRPVTITKKDATGANEVKGATIEILDKDGNALSPAKTAVCGDNGQVTFTLAPGEYKFKETITAPGYTLNSTVYGFTLAADGTVTPATGTDKDDNGLVIKDQPVAFEVSKTSATTGQELPGATMQLYDQANMTTPIAEWTSGSTAKQFSVTATYTQQGQADKVTTLETGKTYVLRENLSPVGYKKINDFAFTINSDGSLTPAEGNVGQQTTVDGKKIIARDEVLTINFDKIITGGTTKLAGAKLAIYKGTDTTNKNNLVAQWTSGQTIYACEKLALNTTYTLVEEEPPTGYAKADPITFSINDSGQAVVDGNTSDTVTMTDTNIKLKISKQGLGGTELPGASMELVDQTAGTSVATWTSGTTPYEVGDKLIIGHTYVLKETAAPDGYTIATNITFTINDKGQAVVNGVVDGNGDAITMTDDVKPIFISKKKITGTSELTGATMTVYKAVQNPDGTYTQGDQVDSWTSAAAAHEMKVGTGATNLTLNETYMLVEETAPDGYAKAESIVFTVTGPNKVQINGETGTTDTVVMRDAQQGKIYISKKAALGDDVAQLAGAELTLKDQDGTVITTWNSGEKHELSKLDPGTYTVTETKVPDGYVKAADVTFTVKEDGTVEYNGATVSEITMVDKPISVNISKVDATNSQEIAGAKLTVAKKDGTTKDEWSWTSEAGKNKTLTGLTPGDYTLTEVTAPEGYEVAETVSFTIKEDGSVVDANGQDLGGTVTMQDKPHTYISKQDMGGKELAGATMTVTDADGNEVDRWTSDGTVHKIVGLTTGATYTLHEEGAPAGYLVATDIPFVIGTDGKVLTAPVTMKDAPTSFVISKVAVTGGAELPGAKLTLKTEGGTLVKSWTSTSTPETFTNLAAGNYILHEDAAPDGYVVSNDITFELKADGSVGAIKVNGQDANGVQMVDTVNGVGISKTDLGSGKELAGAKLEVVKKDDAAVTWSWTSDGTTHTIDKVPDGDYTLTETSAPAGYVISQSIDFTVKDGVVTSSNNVVDGVVVMTDDYTKVQLSKSDITTGSLIAGAELKVVNGAGETVASWTTEEGKSKAIDKLAPGKYTLVETTAPEGYDVAESVEFTVAETGDIQKVEMKDTTTTYISKVDIGGEEIEGATLQILDKNNTVVAQWVSKKDETHKVTGLTTGETYTLREATHPFGYITTQDKTFVVGTDGKVVTSPIKMVDEYKQVTISKVAITGGDELPGATLQITDKDGKVIDKWVSTDKVHQVEAGLLNPGDTYTLTEITAPDGYLKAQDVTFTVNDNYEVDQQVEMVDEVNGVGISKTDLGTGKELAGAKLEVVKKDDASVKWSWTSDGTIHVIDKVPDGDYTLTETSAPNGYALSESIDFTVKDGVVTSSNNVVDGVVVMKDDYTKVQFSKTDITTGKQIAGAELKIVDAKGATVAKWTTEEGKSKAIDKLAPGKYTLVETTAPDGYDVAESVEFTVADTGDMQKVEMKDDTTTYISKVDIGGNEIEGATLQVIDKNGKVVEEWVSKKGETHKITGLTTGETYTLREITHPFGYINAEDKTFVVGEDGKVVTNPIMMVDAYKQVTISKVAITGGDELPGATLQITDKDGKVIDKWVSTNKAHQVEAGLLNPGDTYTLTEITAPSGYAVAENITFTVNDNYEIEQTVEMVDSPISVTFAKQDVDGNLIKGASLELRDTTGKVVASWVTDGTQHKIDNLPAGSYQLVETKAPDGYTIASPISITVNVEGDVAGSATNLVTMLDVKTNTYISKVDIGGEEIEGATLQVIDKNGKVVEEWVSKKGESHHITGLTEGETYTLRETTHPFGYITAEDKTFVVGADGTVITNPIMMVDAYKTVSISKTDITTSKELPGATLIVVDKNGKEVDRWVSGDTPHQITGLNPGDSYTLREITAPNGYLVAEDITFKVEDDGTVQAVVMQDRPLTDVIITKSDLTTGEKVQNSTVTVYDSNHNVVFEGKTDANGEINLGKLEPGTYTFEETIAPAGYDRRTNSFTFTVNADGTITGDTSFSDAPLQLDISKVAITGGSELPGATLTLTDKETGVVVDQWTSTGTAHRVPASKLHEGRTYVLHEVAAPNGYAYATDIEFVLQNTGAVQKIEMVDNAIPNTPSNNVNTGIQHNGPGMAGTALVLMGMAVAVVILKKRTRKDN